MSFSYFDQDFIFPNLKMISAFAIKSNKKKKKKRLV